MATINKSVLGKVHGTIGDITFRQRNGKNYISTRPDSYTASKDSASIARRNKFSLSIKLAKAIYSIDELKSLWRTATPPGLTPFNQVMRTNYPLISATDLSGLVSLTPSLGFSVSNPAVTLGPADITVTADAIGDLAKIDVAAEPSLKLVSMVFLSNPSDELMSEYSFLEFITETQQTDLTAAMNFSIPFGNVETQIFSGYQNKKGFFALITLDADGNTVHYSSTFTS